MTAPLNHPSPRRPCPAQCASTICQMRFHSQRQAKFSLESRRWEDRRLALACVQLLLLAVPSTARLNTLLYLNAIKNQKIPQSLRSCKPGRFLLSGLNISVFSLFVMTDPRPQHLSLCPLALPPLAQQKHVRLQTTPSARLDIVPPSSRSRWRRALRPRLRVSPQRALTCPCPSGNEYRRMHRSGLSSTYAFPPYRSPAQMGLRQWMQRLSDST